MAQEMTDAEVFGTPELSDEEVFANLAPPSVTKEDRLFNRIQSGQTPSSLFPLALRMGVPIGLSTLVAPETALGAAAIGALGGAIGETGAQSVELARGQRQNISPREILAGGFRNAIPVVNEVPFSPLLKLPANALLQGAGATAADVIAGQGFNPATTGAAALLGGGIPAVQPIVTRGGRGVVGAVNALRSGEDLVPALKAGAAEAFRPIVQHPYQTEALNVRKQIEGMTGKPGQEPVNFPIAISEVIGEPKITTQMRIPGAELTEGDLKQLSDTAFHFAANTDRSDRSANEVARQVFDVLGGKKEELNAATRKAIEDFSQRATRVANDADAAIERQFSLLYPGGRSRATIGKDISAGADLVHEEARKIWNAAYEKAKFDPATGGIASDWANVTVPADDIRDVARLHGMDFAKTDDGGIALIAAPKETRNVIESAKEISGGKMHPDLLTLDQARSLATELGRRIHGIGAIGTVDKYVMSQLRMKLQDSIENAIKPYPRLVNDLGAANEMFKENIGRFDNSLSKGILNDAGEKGGLLPEAIVAKLTGPSAESYLDNLEELFGKPSASGKTVGTDLSGEARKLASEAFLSQARAAGTGIGEVDLGKAFDMIQKVPEPVRNKLFPRFGDMEAAAKAQKDIQAVSKFLKSPKRLVTVPLPELQKAFAAKDATDLVDLAKNAITTSEANAAELSRLSLDKLAQRDQFDVFKYITDDRNSGRVRDAMMFIDKANPQLAKDVRALYIDNLIELVSGTGKTSPTAVADALALPSAKSAKGQGTLGGASAETADAVLGKPAVDDLRRMAELLKTVPKPENIALSEQRSFLSWLGLGNIGTSAASKTGWFGLLGRTFVGFPAIKYRLAADILTDQKLRREAMQATGPQLRDVVNRGLSMVTQDLARQFGWKSQQVQKVEQIRASLLNANPSAMTDQQQTNRLGQRNSFSITPPR